MNSSFWLNKRVFVTGHTGFKGSWLSLWLQHLGAIVTGYALKPSTSPNLFGVVKVAEGINSITGDIRNGGALTEAMRAAQPDIVIHMAAQPLVRYSYINPVETYSTNIMGTVNLLEAVRQSRSVRAVVNVTSDKCYENNEWLWGYRESEPMGGFDPYSSSKGCAELVTAAYRNSFFNSTESDECRVSVATARAGNVIGGGDWAEERLVPDVLQAIQSGQSVSIRNPRSTRPWQHVLEPLSGYILLAEKLYDHGPDFAEAFNFGPAERDVVPVEWLVEQLIQTWGVKASWHLDGSAHFHEAHALKLDSSKARTMLGWRPRWSLEQAVSAIVTWHQAYNENASSAEMRALCLRQIEEYLRNPHI